jgi:glyoxylase-like metal-dependent hydrolase (beta-lactamase superfamily II)
MKPIARLPLLAASSLMAAGLLHAGIVDTSYRDARAVLDAGIRAAGGVEALRAIKDVRRVGTATAYALGQSLAPAEPLVTRQIEQTSVVDFAGGRARTETTTSGTGIVTARNLAVLNGEQSFGYNLVTRGLNPVSAAGAGNQRNGLRRDPAVLLLQALSRAETLRSLGPRAITFSDTDGTQIALSFDAAGLLATQETMADHAVLGDALTEISYSDYRDVSVGDAKVRLPFRVVTKLAGETTQDMKYSTITANAGLPAESLAAPPNAERVAPAATQNEVTATRLGEDAYVLGGGSHHSLAVGFKDQVLVVEAPLNDDRSLAVLRKVNELFPSRSIRLVPTHYHFDHSGGIRTYVGWGLPILTTPGNKAFIEKMAATPHTIRPDTLSKDPKKPNVETFTGKKVVTDGTRTLELYDVGPNPHVKEAVVAYLPREKVLFVADLFSLAAAPSVVERSAPPSPALVDFNEKITRLGLAVDVLVPAHGRQGTMEDLKAALAARPPQD